MVERSPATVTKPVRALGAAVHDLTTERHEPDKPRGLRPDLWGTAGEIPAVYPALSVNHAIPQLLPSPDGTAKLSSTAAAAGPAARNTALSAAAPIVPSFAAICAFRIFTPNL